MQTSGPVLFQSRDTRSHPRHCMRGISNIWQLINIPVSGKRHLREKTSLFRESFATPSPSPFVCPFVCSMRSGAIVAAAVMLAHRIAARVQYVVLSASSHRHSPLPLALAADVRNLATSSLAFRRSFADLSRNLLQNSPANVIDLRHSQHRQGINNASVGAAYLPLQGSGVCKYVSAQACLQKSNAESFAKK